MDTFNNIQNTKYIIQINTRKTLTNCYCAGSRHEAEHAIQHPEGSLRTIVVGTETVVSLSTSVTSVGALCKPQGM